MYTSLPKPRDFQSVNMLIKSQDQIPEDYYNDGLPVKISQFKRSSSGPKIRLGVDPATNAYKGPQNFRFESFGEAHVFGKQRQVNHLKSSDNI